MREKKNNNGERNNQATFQQLSTWGKIFVQAAD